MWTQWGLGQKGSEAVKFITKKGVPRKVLLRPCFEDFVIFFFKFGFFLTETHVGSVMGMGGGNR